MPRWSLFSKRIFDHVHQVLRRQLVPVAQSGDLLDKGAGDRDVGHLAEKEFAAPLSAPDADAIGCLLYTSCGPLGKELCENRHDLAGRPTGRGWGGFQRP